MTVASCSVRKNIQCPLHQLEIVIDFSGYAYVHRRKERYVTIWRKFCHATRTAWPIHHLAKTYRLLTDVILQNVSTTDIAESIQPSKFEWENASPQATRSGELHNTMHPGEPSTPRDTWEYRHLKQRLFTGSGRSGSICFTCDMIISLTSFMSISKCSIPNGTLVCARRDGPMSSGSEREIIMLAIFVVRCTRMAFIVMMHPAPRALYQRSNKGRIW